jgi:nicotinamide-nucleotide amidase
MIVEILCVGTELLSGITLNTNADWLCGEITNVGGIVRRVTVVRDDLSEISSAARESLAREPSIVITTGGLGATYDDMTLEGIAVALGKKVMIDVMAIEMLKKSYAMHKLHQEMTDSRLKMATIPERSTPIQNPVGTAPAIMDQAGGITIFCLPGVPSEMKAIVKSHPKNMIYLKTHPRGYYRKKTPQIKIQLISRGDDEKEVKERLAGISKVIEKEIVKLGGTIC